MEALDQKRMSTAYAALNELGPDDMKAFVGLGAEIQRCGMLQALAFLHRGPTKSVAGKLCHVLQKHLSSLGHMEKSQKSLLAYLRDLKEVRAYQRLTRETVALCVWLRRVAQIGDV